MRKHLKASLAPFKYPRRIEIFADLPNIVAGKIQRFRLRDPKA